MKVILSYGMGVESTAILARWVFEPETRPCDLADLVVVTAQTGDEYADTGRDVTECILPLMREHGIRYVQLARHGHLEAAGITVLEDSNSPTRVYLHGDYRLSDELRSNGTVPQFGGEHRCSLKFKAFVIKTWLRQHQTGPVRHAFGYNVSEQRRVDECESATARRIAFGFNREEQARIERTIRYDSSTRESFFPLVEWGWSREDCVAHLKAVFGITWKKSAYVELLKADAVERHRRHPEQVADAMLLELLSLALNPRGTLYPNKSLIQITWASGDESTAAEFQARLLGSRWSVYRVRRIYHARKTDGIIDPKKKGMADRAVEQVQTFSSREEADRCLDGFVRSLGLDLETSRGLRYAYRERRESEYPAREEFYTVAPSHVPTKARYGIERFDDQWTARQRSLFKYSTRGYTQREVSPRFARWPGRSCSGMFLRSLLVVKERARFAASRFIHPMSPAVGWKGGMLCTRTCFS